MFGAQTAALLYSALLPTSANAQSDEAAAEVIIAQQS
ncbi:hypothetical protein ABIA00_000158 [Bradyrhizobium ottawaense]